jgi:hypothetical protein
MIDPAGARKGYQDQLEEHCSAIRRTCHRMGGSYARLLTSQPLEFALFDFLRARSQRGRKVRRSEQRSTVLR